MPRSRPRSREKLEGLGLGLVSVSDLNVSFTSLAVGGRDFYSGTIAPFDVGF